MCSNRGLACDAYIFNFRALVVAFVTTITTTIITTLVTIELGRPEQSINHVAESNGDLLLRRGSA